MACGTPVITSNTSSLPEVVGDAGIMVDPLDVKALADAIERVVTDDALRSDLRARGLERSKMFTWERAAEAHIEVYRSVAALYKVDSIHRVTAFRLRIGATTDHHPTITERRPGFTRLHPSGAHDSFPRDLNGANRCATLVSLLDVNSDIQLPPRIRIQTPKISPKSAAKLTAKLTAKARILSRMLYTLTESDMRTYA